MRIHFLTTRICEDSGGAIYDSNLFDQLKKRFGNSLLLFDDKTILAMCESNKKGLLAFHGFYKKVIHTLLNCDYLFVNSRLYTRLLTLRLKNRKTKCKIIIIHHHNNYMSYSFFGARIIHKYFEYGFIKQADRIIIPNKYVVDLVKKIIPEYRIVFLESSFDKRANLISELNNKRVLFVGNIQERKGVLFGIKAFSIAVKAKPDLVFNLVGKYETNSLYYRKINKLINSLGINKNINFLGRVSKEELDYLYSYSDLFLFPSLLEGYGWVMIEAMSRGLPVVCFNNSAMPYTVRDGYNGLIIQNKNWKQMGLSLSILLSKPEVMKNLQDGALRTFESVKSKEELNNDIIKFISSFVR